MAVGSRRLGIRVKLEYETPMVFWTSTCTYMYCQLRMSRKWWCSSGTCTRHGWVKILDKDWACIGPSKRQMTKTARLAPGTKRRQRGNQERLRGL